MIKKIIEFSATNRLMVLIAVAALSAMAWSTLRTARLDALPDLSDTQVIIYSRWDRSPDIIEDQVTYPIVSALLGAPRVRAIRGFSDFGFSYVYVIFQDGTDLYWARSRTLEYLSKISQRLPQGVATELGPDATGVGWVFQYALVDRKGAHGLDELRSFQDWTLRYAVQSVPGVAEVASIGGFVKQYQITVDPNRLQAYDVPLDEVVMAIRSSNNEVGGRLIEWSGKEYMVRGRGYARDLQAFESIVVKVAKGGVPVLLRDVARVELGPEIRRGVSDLDGTGDTVGGIVVMRHGENALEVIDRVKQRLEELKPSLPDGVEVVTTYDRADLIHRAMETLRHELVVEMIVVAAIILLFLWHVPSAMVPIATIPLSVLLAFIPLYYMGVTVNIMSLAGIAISIGVLVDGAIVEVENAYNKLQRWEASGRKGDVHQTRLKAAQGGGTLGVLLAAGDRGRVPSRLRPGRLEGGSSSRSPTRRTSRWRSRGLLAITLDPAMRMLFFRMDPFTFRPRWLAWVLTKLLVGTYHSRSGAMAAPSSASTSRPAGSSCTIPWKVIIAAALVVLASLPAMLSSAAKFLAAAQRGASSTYPRRFKEDVSRAGAGADANAGSRPEGLPRSGPGVGKGRARRHLHRSCPVLDDGDHGRAEAVSEWRAKPRWYSARSGVAEARPAPDRRPISWDKLVDEMDAKLAIVGVTNAVDDADRGAHRHAHHRCADAHRHQGLRRTLRDRGDRRAPRVDPARRPRHEVKYARPGNRRRLLRRLRAAPNWSSRYGLPWWKSSRW
ncbi:MAG: efflux RND transporter permease subunit [Acidobacteriota bacterium]